jgi:hypothetical protein
MKNWIPAAGLVILGCIQMAGDLSGNSTLRAIGLASHASPAPKVFTAQQGFETFASRFYIDWSDVSGQQHSIEITPRNYGGIEGPYNRRNAYGAALSYGPVLAANEKTRPMLDSVMDHAFCGAAPLLRELSIPPEQVRYPLQVRIEPRAADSKPDKWQRVFTVTCQGERS